MGEYSTIMARDGHEFQAWLAAAPGRPRGAVVVIQEIFGVNSHIRKVSDGFAADGYTTIAPCLFDRVRRGIELGYTAADMQEGSGYTKQLTPEDTLRDLAAAIAVVRHSGRADRSIPLADIERIKAANPQAPLFVYEGAGHGFNCEQREAYNPQVAALARTRTLDFLGRHVAGGEPLKG